MKRLLSFWVSLACVVIAACGGSNTVTDPGGGGGDPGGGVPPDEITVEMGSGTPPNFMAGMIEVAVANLAAGGSTSLTVTFVTSEGLLFTQDVDVTFSSACIASGLASITGSTTTNTGILTVTYGATGCNGDDVITATAVVQGTILSANGSVNVAPAAVGSIEFISAVPQKIGLQGTGGVGISETSTVAFRVVDSTGGPVAGTDVQFALDTTVGGINLSPSTATSGADGRVQTVVQSGTVATSVRVSATIVGSGISTQSSQLTVTTGLPDQNSVSLAVECHNVEAWDLDGTQNAVTVRLSDRFNNPVPDGTAVTLNTEGGRIDGSCVTETTATESGICTVNWTSSNPRPVDGRSSIIATVIGEESFTDVNGNGYFDDADSWTDLDEAFRDDNENGSYDPGEFFFDFNNDNMYTLADGQFNGLLCGGPGPPPGADDTLGRCGTSATTGISTGNLIIMSGSTAVVTDNVGGVLTGGGTVILTIGDVNNQPMPGGTTISATSSNGSIAGPTSYTVPCTTNNGPLDYAFTVEGDLTPPASGILTVEVKVPSGLTTIYFVTLNDS